MIYQPRTVTVPFEAVKDIHDRRYPQEFRVGEKLVFLAIQEDRTLFRLRKNRAMKYLADTEAFNQSTVID
jgi:phosphoribosyl 1,2-cyclic phosphodiesterase